MTSALKRITAFLLLLALASPAIAQYKESGSTWYGPKYVRPAKFTGESIKSAIDRARKTSARVYFPPGKYDVKETLVLDSLGPIRIEGEALAGQYVNQDQTRSVELRWVGAPGGTMIRLNGFAVQLGNLSLNGMGNAARGILFANTVSNDPKRTQTGTALNRLYDVHLYGFTDTAIQAGETWTDHNATDTFFERVNFSDSHTGFRLEHAQGVAFNFRDCYWGGLNIGIHLKTGGGVWLDGGGTAGVDLLIRTENLTRHGANVTVHNVRGEANGKTTAWMQLIDSDWSAAKFVIDGFRLAGGKNTAMPDNGKPFVQLRIANVASFRDCEVIAERQAVIRADGNFQGPMRIVLDNSVGMKVEKTDFVEVVER